MKKRPLPDNVLNYYRIKLLGEMIGFVHEGKLKSGFLYEGIVYYEDPLIRHPMQNPTCQEDKPSNKTKG